MYSLNIRLVALVNKAKELGQLEAEDGLHSGDEHAEQVHEEKKRRARFQINFKVRCLEKTFNQQNEKFLNKLKKQVDKIKA